MYILLFIFLHFLPAGTKRPGGAGLFVLKGSPKCEKRTFRDKYFQEVEGLMKTNSIRMLMLFLALVLLPGAKCWGAEWQLVATLEAGQFFLDVSSIVEKPGNTKQAWVRFSLTREGTRDWEGRFGEKFKDMDRITTVEEYDCNGQKRRILYSNFSAKGKLLFSENDSTDWENVIPATPTYSIWRLLCPVRAGNK